MSNPNNQKKLPSQTMLMIRGFLACYLIYMAVDMIKTENHADPRMIVMGCAVLFIISGVVLIADLIRIFIKREYEGGKADDREE